MPATPPPIDAASRLGGLFEGPPAGYALLDAELRLVAPDSAMVAQPGTTHQRFAT